MRNKTVFGLFFIVFATCVGVIFTTYASLNAITYLAWMLCPQLICMLIYWLGVFTFQPDTRSQKLIIGINAGMYGVFIGVVSLLIERFGGVTAIVANSSHLASNGIEVSLDRSPLVSMFLVILVFALIQYAFGKVLSKARFDKASR